MKKLSLHTTEKEWACKCCGLCRPSDKIIRAAEVARFGVNVKWDCINRRIYDGRLYEGEIYLHITSGTRCKAHNDKPQKEGGAGGSKNSEHIVITSSCATCPGFPQRICYSCDGIGVVPTGESQAIDGFFYYIVNGKQIRIDASEVLVYMWECGLIQGLVLYPASVCPDCKGNPNVGRCEHCYKVYYAEDDCPEGIMGYKTNCIGTSCMKCGNKILPYCPTCGGDGTILDYRFHISTGTRYTSWKDLRGEK